MGTDGKRKLVELARRRDGLFTYLEALALGLTLSMIRCMVARGEVERVHRGVYRFVASGWSWHAKQRAAVMAGGTGACISHAGAARWLGLDCVPVGRPEITVEGSSLPLLKGVRVHRTRALPDEDVVEVNGERCTTGSRTCLDLAGRLARVRRLDLVDRAICAGVTTRSRLHDRAVVLRPGRTGLGDIIEVTRPDAEGDFWSALERAFGTGVARTDLPTPQYNAPLRHAGRLLYADALWGEHQLVVELKACSSTARRRGAAETMSA